MSNVNFLNLYDSDIPNGWKRSRYKYHISIENGYPFKSELFDRLDGFPLIRIRDISSGTVETFYQGEVLPEYVVYEDDLLIGMDGDFNCRWWKGPQSLLNQRCCRIREGVSFDRRFLFYILPLQLKVINDLTYFTTVKHLSSNDVLNDECWIPPLHEQKLISRYLDNKTNQIDSLIEKIQKKIDLLKEQRTSLINQCVTKGLDPNVEMKDSGVEWIGEIPKHWKMNRLCNLGRFKKGKNITKNDLVEVGHPVILYSHLYTTYQRTVTDPKFFISIDTESNSTKIYKNTFLFTSSGESREDIGKCLLFLGIKTSVGGDQVIFELNNFENFDPEFFSFTFNSEFCVHQKSSNSRGEIVVHIYEKQLREIRVPVPPLNEQIEIREKLVDFENTSTKLVDKLETKIKVLKEYRQSLISSVVTGKVRVSEDMI